VSSYQCKLHEGEHSIVFVQAADLLAQMLVPASNQQDEAWLAGFRRGGHRVQRAVRMVVYAELLVMAGRCRMMLHVRFHWSYVWYKKRSTVHWRRLCSHLDKV